MTDLRRTISSAPLMLRGLMFGAVFVVAIALVFLFDLLPVADKTVEAYAQRIMEQCAEAHYRPLCYESEVPKLLNEISLPDAFAITRIIQARDPAFGYCHVLGHKIALQETKKRPGEWFSIFQQCPSDGLCSYGCQHGVLQEKYRAETISDADFAAIAPDFARACMTLGTDLGRAECFHGLGHLTVYLTGGDLQRAANNCDTLVTNSELKSFKNVCYEGLFMQLFQPLEPEDFSLIEGQTPEPNDLRRFCESFAIPDRIEACWREGWPLFRNEIKTASGLMSFCETPTTQDYRNLCYQMLFHTLGQGGQFNTADIAKTCSAFPLVLAGQCFGNAALAMIQSGPQFIDRAVKLCADAQHGISRADCYRILADMAAYHFGFDTPDFRTLCDALPAAWHDRCRGGYQRSSPQRSSF